MYQLSFDVSPASMLSFLSFYNSQPHLPIVPQ